VGPYEIDTALGAGGMDELYRACDATLNRAVAAKILPSEFAIDSERLARFDREASTLAALNHPNITHIHGFDDSTGTPAPVIERIEYTSPDPACSLLATVFLSRIRHGSRRLHFTVPSNWPAAMKK